MIEEEKYIPTEEEFENGFELSGSNFSQWAVLSNGAYLPAYKTAKLVPPGLYEIKWSSEHNSLILVYQEMNLDELYKLPSIEIESIIKDIKGFWNSKDVYKKHKFIYKRGILLYGQPGCGKSGIIQLCVSHVIEEMKGIVINIKEEDDVDVEQSSPTINTKISPLSMTQTGGGASILSRKGGPTVTVPVPSPSVPSSSLLLLFL